MEAVDEVVHEAAAEAAAIEAADDATEAAEAADAAAYDAMNHRWVTSMSNAVMMSVHALDRMDDVSKLSIEHNYSIKDGCIKRCVQVDFFNRDSRIVRMNAPFV